MEKKLKPFDAIYEDGQHYVWVPQNSPENQKIPVRVRSEEKLEELIESQQRLIDRLKTNENTISESKTIWEQKIIGKVKQFLHTIFQ